MFSENGMMDPVRCTDFIKFTTASPHVPVLPTDERIVGLFARFDSD